MTLRVLLIDHYDSFTQLIKSYFEVLGAEVVILQSSPKILNTDYIKTFSPTHIVLSPGPGRPCDVPDTQAFILKYYTKYPILGICLGHQCFAEAFGGRVVQASEIYHGICSKIYHLGSQSTLFKSMPEAFLATRYHSLVVQKKTLPRDWMITAWTYDAKGQSVIMGIEHMHYPLFGVQYHPEAILSEQGQDIFNQFLLYPLQVRHPELARDLIQSGTEQLKKPFKIMPL